MMIKNTIGLLILLLPLSCYGQDKYNYIRSTVMLDSSATRQSTTVQYYDGLGRPTVTVSDGVSGNGERVSTAQYYDGLDRITRQYLPVSGDAGSSYGEDEMSSHSYRTYGDNLSYSDVSYDALDRKLESTIPGAAWRGKSNKTAYSVNAAGEVRRFSAPLGVNTLKDAGYYSAGTLSGVTTTDADGHSLTIYTDMDGRKVLERRDKNSDTYFVYNDLGQLRFVLPPIYQSCELKNKKAITGYEYRYDGRGRLIKKILPGCNAIQYWYDYGDRMVFMQDESLRLLGRFRFMLYDKLGRPAVQGLCSDCNRNDQKLPVVTFQAGSGGVGGSDYRLNLDYFLTRPVIEKVIYYDNYDFMSGSFKAGFSGLEVNTATSAKGLPTGTVERASNGELLYSVTAYDIRGNVTETKARGLGGRTVSSKNGYTFTNNPRSSCTTMNVGGKPVTIQVSNSFNAHNDKLEAYTLTLSQGGTPVSMTMKYEYDNLGRLKTVTRPIGSGEEGAVNYDYDLHGWTRAIRTNSFKESLYYADGTGTPCYNGNISSLTWSNKGTSTNRGYQFLYDGLDRLKTAKYAEDDFSINEDRYNETMQYDMNGNITHLTRTGLMQTGGYGAIDDLSMSYVGNQLSTATDAAAPVLREGSMDFKGNGSCAYAYNGNGALVSDQSRGIAKIDYDANNNPRRIQFVDGNITKYVYSASGQKLRTIHYTADSHVAKVAYGQTHELTNAEILCADSTDYLLDGSLILENGRISRYLFGGGYCDFIPSSSRRNRGSYCSLKPNRSSFENDEDYARAMDSWGKKMAAKNGAGAILFYFYNKDHLGNIREVVSQHGAICQVNNYYPFGIPYSDPSATINPKYQPYKYNGKELDLMHGLNTYDYGARQYNPVLPTWDRVDPLAEKYYNMSPYVYCINNPPKFVDTEGKFPHKLEAKLSRRLHNLTSNKEAGPIFYNKDAKDSKFKYTYNTIESDGNGGFIVTSTYKFDTKWTESIQTAGDVVSLAGYAATLTGVGAEVGVPAAVFGNTISAIGSGVELGLNFLNEDYEESLKDGAFDLVGAGIEFEINRIIPGSSGPNIKKACKYLFDTLRGHNTGKSILGNDFNLGKSILLQGASLKLELGEEMTDKVIERYNSEHKNH